MFGWFRRRRDERSAKAAVEVEPGTIHQHPERCPLNVPGPFYTTGQCLACEAPEFEAPDLLALLNDENITTYFVKQPETAEEIERACRAIEVCCVNDLRYGGTDRAILERLGNDEETCDVVLRNGRLILSKSAGTTG
ncbi:ferredoxin [Tautonia marina]|uniref:ferredoxin n=1 Tax=Tautonia marina TaxID=2653855 RepID=UPI0012608382|nr:ferredoxin [Tautonia marina]